MAGPTYDSTFANLTKMKSETELVFADMEEEGEELVEMDTGERMRVSFMADHILDILTNNEHSKEINYQEEERRINDQVQVEGERQNIDFDSLKRLVEEGIHVSFLDSLAQKYEARGGWGRRMWRRRWGRTPGQRPGWRKLVNYRRVSGRHSRSNCQLLPPASLAGKACFIANARCKREYLFIFWCTDPSPGEKELELAAKAQESLADMTGRVKPGQVAQVTAIRKAMGISLDWLSISPNEL